MKLSFITLCAILPLPIIAIANEPFLVIIEPAEGYHTTAMLDMSADGRFVAGYSSPQGASNNRGFIWSDGVRHDIIHPDNYADSIVSSVSDDGSTIIAIFSERWASSNRLQYFGPSFGPYINSWPLQSSTQTYDFYGMSGNGNVMYGYVGRPGSSSADRQGPFTWRGSGTEIQWLPHQVPILDTTTLYAYADNRSCMTYDSDILVGISRDSSTPVNMTGVSWRNGEISKVPFNSEVERNDTSASCISNNGRYIGGRAGDQAVIWKDFEVVEVIPEASRIRVIADHGRLGVVATHSVWTKELGVLPSETFSAMYGVPVPSVWTSISIYSISSDGSMFSGSIYSPFLGQRRAFIARSNYKPCFADFNEDGGIDAQDIQAFFLMWETGEPPADVNLDGGVTGDDVRDFFTQWSSACAPS